MTTVFVGQLSLADCLPGVAKVITYLNAAIASLQAAVNVQVDILGGAKAAIRIAAIADLQAQLDATLAVQASLGISVTNPAVYIAGLVEGIVQVQANISALVPALAVNAQLSASLAISAQLTAKIAAFDLVLSALGSIGLALSAAVAIALPTLNLAASVGLYVYSGPLAGLGADVQAAVNASGALAGSATVLTPVLVVDASDTASTASLSACFRLA